MFMALSGIVWRLFRSNYGGFDGECSALVQGPACVQRTAAQLAMQSGTPGAAGAMPSPFLEVSNPLMLAAQ